MKKYITLFIMSVIAFTTIARDVTINVKDMDAEKVFATIMHQTGSNFIYKSDLLKGMKVTINVTAQSLESVLHKIFAETDITFKIKGNNVLLSRKSPVTRLTISGYIREKESGEPLVGAIVKDNSGNVTTSNSAGFYSMQLLPGVHEITVSFPTYETETLKQSFVNSTRIDYNLKEALDENGRVLNEITVVADKNRLMTLESTDIGRLNLSRTDILSTPTLFGESDVIKTLQLQPGVSAGVEGLAGMYVHGGGNDENLYMLDNVPLYQINHFGGLFSAFNSEAIKNVDFYKSTFPAKYSGRLSSIMEVHTKDGDLYRHHGSFKLGLTSGAFQMDGPLRTGKTSYSLAIRRSWYEILTVPALAIFNSVRPDKENNLIARYAFTDVNLKVTHHFSERSSAYAMFYYGNDFLRGGNHSKLKYSDEETSDNKDVSTLDWGNIVGSLGWKYELSNKVFGEFTLAFTHYNSKLKREENFVTYTPEETSRDDYRKYISSNGITDLTLRADLTWNAMSNLKLSYGANATFHSFMPEKSEAILKKHNMIVNDVCRETGINAFSAAAYVGADWILSPRTRLNIGLNMGDFHISGNNNLYIDPRIALLWRATERVSIKGGWSRMSQNVHQLTESAISLPTDQWVPIAGDFKPQKSDKVFLGLGYACDNGLLFSIEGYWKWMKNIIDYRDDYYLYTAGSLWTDLLCSGKGGAKGIDMKVSKSFGKITGHVSYSLLWADRQFDAKNGGKRFPARFDNRHKINAALSWEFNDKWTFNAAWTGMSGNMVTLNTQRYYLLSAPGLPSYVAGDTQYAGNSINYGTIRFGNGINNYRLPFYHRLDLSANRKTKKGMWTFSLYNAYCNMNVISIRENDTEILSGKAFKKFRLIPVIPSVSYTWYF